LIVIGLLGLDKLIDFKINNLVFYGEAVALALFGVSWLTKAELIYKDPKEEVETEDLL